LAEIVPADQLHDLLWKPASPHMARSRNDPRITRGDIARRRNPLVEITMKTEKLERDPVTGAYPGAIGGSLQLTGPEMAEVRKAMLESERPLHISELAQKVGLAGGQKVGALANFIERNSAEFAMIFEERGPSITGRKQPGSLFRGWAATDKLCQAGQPCSGRKERERKTDKADAGTPWTVQAGTGADQKILRWAPFVSGDTGRSDLRFAGRWPGDVLRMAAGSQAAAGHDLRDVRSRGDPSDERFVAITAPDGGQGQA
jgi:hypothetical protein